MLVGLGNTGINYIFALILVPHHLVLKNVLYSIIFNEKHTNRDNRSASSAMDRIKQQLNE
jgi:hypothetical protein